MCRLTFLHSTYWALCSGIAIASSFLGRSLPGVGRACSMLQLQAEEPPSGRPQLGLCRKEVLACSPGHPCPPVIVSSAPSFPSNPAEKRKLRGYIRLISLNLNQRAAIAGVYRAAGKDMIPFVALTLGVGQTFCVVIISYLRILATL
ncbi:hypothetical protein NDU88_001807 [Pleurodeles waltl]|uniref:Transmembrane protein 170A n=1 Tax=Pleurodeles waltl TaxID=8319 RepID=A0AAV7KTL6_PLEWA|nr:hypothetical protein NDU88_001807 [Pleurodeles waltl]